MCDAIFKNRNLYHLGIFSSEFNGSMKIIFIFCQNDHLSYKHVIYFTFLCNEVSVNTTLPIPR